MSLCLLCSGCSTPRRNFYAGQSLDLATTYYALEMRSGFKEGNPLADDMGDVMIMKLSAVSVVELMAHVFPSSASPVYWTGAIAGYAAGGMNLYTIGTAGPDDK